MDYKKVLRLHNVDRLSSREIAKACNCGKTTVNDFIARFNALSVLDDYFAAFFMPINSSHYAVSATLRRSITQELNAFPILRPPPCMREL